MLRKISHIGYWISKIFLLEASQSTHLLFPAISYFILFIFWISTELALCPPLALLLSFPWNWNQSDIRRLLCVAEYFVIYIEPFSKQLLISLLHTCKVFKICCSIADTHSSLSSQEDASKCHCLLSKLTIWNSKLLLSEFEFVAFAAKPPQLPPLSSAEPPFTFSCVFEDWRKLDAELFTPFDLILRWCRFLTFGVVFSLKISSKTRSR